MALSSEQEEEVEVLNSIFEGDEAYKQLDATTFQYKVGDDGSNKSFLLEIKWPKEYPACQPDISLDAFYNKHILDSVKQKIVSSALAEAENMLGEAVTYTLIDWAKENYELLMDEQPDRKIQEVDAELNQSTETPKSGKNKDKKEHLTKAQKRKLADRTNPGGERPRGWDWIDIVKHLSQTGKQPD